MAKELTSFVIMPIRSEGTDDYLHFRTIYEDWIRPVLDSAGYSVVRSDDVQAAGAITKDIVLRLANADLVVADLTDLNPNVFYELGVRHALRGAGTVMLIDEGRTTTVPFDLTAYRVLAFNSDLIGIGKLRRDLSAFVNAMTTNAGSPRRDNPVHDWIPALPLNAAAVSTGSEAEQLRIQVAELERRLRDYEQVYGIVDKVSPTIESASGVILTALQQATQGTMAADLVRDGHTAAATQDRTVFLSAINRIVQSSVRLSPREYLMLCSDARALGLRDVTRALFSIGRRAHPKDTQLHNADLAHLSHSDNPADLERAREEILSLVNIQISATAIALPKSFDREQSLLIGTMLDAYHRDNLHDQALRLCTALVEKFPDSTVFARNYARALEATGQADRALEGYRRSIWAHDADDTSAVWLGSELHNRRRYVDSLEAYVLACLLDPDDATNFGHVAEEIARSLKMQETAGPAKSTRRLPEGIILDTAFQALVAACSCANIGEESISRCSTAAEEAEFDLSVITLIATLRHGTNDVDRLSAMKFAERAEFCRHLYEVLASDLTKRPDESG